MRTFGENLRELRKSRMDRVQYLVDAYNKVSSQ